MRASANKNNYTELIDQHKMLDNSAGGGASTHLWTTQDECKAVTGSTARKKSRKSTMPMKIKMETGDNDT